jgi:AcrR family transcriptional regulator
LRAAETAIVTNQNITLVQIAKTLRIAPSTIYEHFQNRDALIGAAIDRLAASGYGKQPKLEK